MRSKFLYLLLIAVPFFIAFALPKEKNKIIGEWRLIKAYTNEREVPPQLMDRKQTFTDENTFKGIIRFQTSQRPYNDGYYFIVNDSTVVTVQNDITGIPERNANLYNFHIIGDTLHLYGFFLRPASNDTKVLFKVSINEWWVKEKSK